jgi:hypothetical protein
MSFVTRIVPESFRDIGQLILADAIVSVEIGNVDQNGLLHLDQALKVNVCFKSEDTEYNCIFKGNDMVQQASEWLFLKTEGEFNFKEVGPRWLSKMVFFHRVEDKLEHD